MQARCTQMKEDLKRLRKMKIKEDDNSQANTVNSTKNELYLATSEEVAKSEWVMDSVASMRICQDRIMFDSLNT